MTIVKYLPNFIEEQIHRSKLKQKLGGTLKQTIID